MAAHAISDSALPMASDFQKTVAHTGHWINEPSRHFARGVIHLLYSPINRENLLWEIASKVEDVFIVGLSFPLAALSLGLSTPCYLTAFYAGPGRFERLDPPPFVFPLPLPQKKVRIAIINFCAQDPWSLLSGGKLPPLASEPNGQTRADKLIERLIREKPDVLCGQEFDHLPTTQKISDKLTQQGYSCFWDLGCHTLFNHSGLFFAASPSVIDSIAFRRFHPEHVSGVTSWCDRGILEVTVPLQDRFLKVLNFHLNSGSGPKDSTSRLFQLKTYITPSLKGTHALAVGDANLDTSELSDIERAETGLLGLTNALEGQVTCSDEGKHILLGKDRKDCRECKEKIDAIFIDPLYVRIEKIEIEDGYSDHKLIFFTASLVV